MAVWTIQYGLSGLGMRIGSRRGDLISRLVADPRLREDPFPAYDEIRAMGAMAHGSFISATANYATATELLRSDIFQAGPTPVPFPRLARLLDAVREPRALSVVDPPSLIAISAPQHTRLRRLVTRAFTARAIAALSKRVEGLANELLDRIEATNSGTFDVIGSYAALLPVTVIAEILGVPAGMRDLFRELGDDVALALEPGMPWRDYRRSDAASRRFHAWFDEHIARLRREPEDNLLSHMIQAADGADRLTDTELRVTAMLVLGAGFETTVNLIGNAVPLLLANPGQLDRLRREPAGWPNAIEEVLRHDSPVQFTLRIPREDAEVAGTSLPAGRPVLILLGGANRDPAVFPDPNVFDTARANAREHLAFSSGVHFCLGAQLARLEAATATRVLFERFPDLRLDGRPVRRGNRVLRGYTHMPLAPQARVGVEP
ncbi:cytochrome P450 [Actinocrispum wychmicini]|nr:cytochrome P450 [Actinocrispum wychmicini]